MNELQIKTLEDIDRFLTGVIDTSISLQGGKQEVYSWIERTLVLFRYLKLEKKEKGQVLRYVERLTGYSRQHLTKLVKQYRKTGYIRHQRRRVKQGFATKYTREDIRLLAEVDRIVEGISGTTVKALCEREFEVYGDQQFSRLQGVSVSHLYNLRKGKVYQRCRQIFTKTNPVKVNIGERCKPSPNGNPGYLRVDSVHQGDLDGKKGVYHVNAVDEVTQWEVVVTVERINNQFMIPALTSIIDQFPFVIKGFHSDNGSEYINRQVANLLNFNLVKLTKSRPRNSNDNALAESKNNSVVRKTFGYIHIPQKHAGLMEIFNQEHLNPCLNFHRPCHFPTIEISDKGKQKRRYRQENMKTPYEKLKSLPGAQLSLKEGITFATLKSVAMKHSDLDAWRLMQKARDIMFDNIFEQDHKAA